MKSKTKINVCVFRQDPHPGIYEKVFEMTQKTFGGGIFHVTLYSVGKVRIRPKNVTVRSTKSC